MRPLTRSVAPWALVAAAAIAAPPVARAQCEPPPSGVVSWWDFDSDASDRVGSNDGTPVGGAFVAGQVGNAYEPGGAWIDVPHDASLVLDEVTLEAWVRVDAGSSKNQVVFWKGDGAGSSVTGPYTLTIALGTPRPLVQLGDGASFQLAYGSPLAVGQWTHVAFTVDAAEVRLYLDGAPDGVHARAVGPLVNSGFPARIGALPGFPANQLLGAIDELTLYDRALSAAEIQAIHQAGAAGKCKVVDVAPTANAGPDQSIHAGDTVFLDGSASFDDNTDSANLLYAWSFTARPAGSAAVLSAAGTSAPSFVADLPGTYRVQLVVTDEAALDSAPDEVEISSTNLAPTADAGVDQGGVVSQFVVLGGSGSDPELDPLTFAWSFQSVPVGSAALLLDPTTAAPSFVPDLAGSYVVQLVVNDGFVDSPPDAVEITVVTGAQHAENRTLEALDDVVALSPGQVTTKGNQKALSNFLSQAIRALQAGDLDEARDKLEKARARTDGCVLRGSPDGNGPGRDWVTDCIEQAAIHGYLTEALDALSP